MVFHHAIDRFLRLGRRLIRSKGVDFVVKTCEGIEDPGILIGIIDCGQISVE